MTALKSVHKGSKSRAKPFKNCKAAHHILLCELDISKLLKTKHEKEDSDDGSKDLDDEKLHDLHMRFIINQISESEGEQSKGEDRSEEESDNTETVDEMIKESKPNTKMKDKGSTHKSEVTEMKEIYQELLKTLNEHVAKEDVVDTWWKSVVMAI